MADGSKDPKERWAEKVTEDVRVPKSEERLPPGQHVSKNFPVLDLGIKPKVSLNEWQLDIKGTVANPLSFDWESFSELPTKDIVCDFHCVTTWSLFDMPWSGVPFAHIIEQVKPSAETKFILLTSYDGYTTNVPYELCQTDDALIATHWNNEPLSVEHGGPARFFLPQLYAWKSAKFLKTIEFAKEDQPGYWEKRGYSTSADPWTNDRFSNDG